MGTVHKRYKKIVPDAANNLSITLGSDSKYASFDPTNGRLQMVQSQLYAGDYAASYATGSALAFTSTITGIAKFYGESTSDLTSAVNARTIVGRHLVVTASGTVNHETYGIIGQVCVKNTSLGHYHGGVMGTYESNTAATILTSYGVGGLVGRVGAEGTTVNSGGLLAGVLAVENTSSWTNNGTIAAFATKKASGKTAWPLGLYFGTGDVVKAGTLTGTTDGLYVTVAGLTAGDGYSGLRSVVTCAAPSNTYGTAGYFETDITGTAAGTVYGFGSWLNFNASSSGGSQMLCAQDNGIWSSATGTPLASAKLVIGMRMECVIEGGGNPGSLFLFSTNIYDNVLTALFDVNALVDMGGSSGAASGNDYKIPFIKDATANRVWYVNLYHT